MKCDLPLPKLPWIQVKMLRGAATPRRTLSSAPSRFRAIEGVTT